MNIRYSTFATWSVALAGLSLLQCSSDSQVADDGSTNDKADITFSDSSRDSVPTSESSSASDLDGEGAPAHPPRLADLPQLALVVTNASQETVEQSSAALVTTGSAHAISGFVKGTILAGVNVNVTGAATSNVVTDSAGTFAIPNLSAGSYTLTPSLTGYGFYPSSLAVTMNAADVTGRSFVSTIPLSNALQAGKHAIYYLASPVSFANASYSVDGLAYSPQQAQTFILNKLSPLQVYLTDNGIRAYHPDYYDQPLTVTRGSDGSITLSFSRADKTPAELLTLRVKGTSVSVFYSYAWSYVTYGTRHVVGASGEFTGLFWGSPESSWTPSPPYDLRGAILSNGGVYLTWKDDSPPGSIARYEVYRDGTSVPIATVPSRAYADHAVRTNEDLLRCRNLLCTIRYNVVAVPATGSASKRSVGLTVSSQNGSQDVPKCISHSNCPSGFACYTDGLCRQL